ncbi:hypothetical protein FXE87_08830 [Vibrio mimicus]|nr:hypothetical protein FXE87_08830 [Vibrio mimicus]
MKEIALYRVLYMALKRMRCLTKNEFVSNKIVLEHSLIAVVYFRGEFFVPDSPRTVKLFIQ